MSDWKLCGTPVEISGRVVKRRLSGISSYTDWISSVSATRCAVRDIFVESTTSFRPSYTVNPSARPLSLRDISSNAGFPSTRRTADGFNAQRSLKLGPPATSSRLQQVIRSELTEAGEEMPLKGELPAVETKYLVPPIEPNALPTAMDVERELQAIRDQRKRIRLGGDDRVDGEVKVQLPSICTFTLFDNGEGWVFLGLAEDRWS